LVEVKCECVHVEERRIEMRRDGGENKNTIRMYILPRLLGFLFFFFFFFLFFAYLRYALVIVLKHCSSMIGYTRVIANDQEPNQTRRIRRKR